MSNFFALIGCNKIARKHACAIDRMIPNASIAAVVDIVAERARAMGEEYGAPWFTNYHEMMAEVGDDIDIVNILTPSGTHCRNVLDLVQYGKALVVEKPIALRLDEADRMVRACDAAGVKLFGVQQNRYNLAIVAAKKALDQGRFGRLTMGTVRVRWKRDQAYYDSADWRGTWAYDGGVFTNQASHHIDMLKWFFGDVQSVRAMAATHLVDIETEDTGVAILRFSSGALGIIEATTAARPRDLEGSISILGEKGTVVIGGFAMDRLETWEFEEPHPMDDTVFAEYGANPDTFAFNHAEYLKGVIDSVENRRAALVDGLEARRSLELITGLYESIETGRDVELRFQPRLCRLGKNHV